MTDTMPTSTLAGFTGVRWSEPRPYAAVVCAAPAGGRGSGRPAGSSAAVPVPAPGDEPGRRLLDQQFTEHDGTTLGIQSSGGPQG